MEKKKKNDWRDWNENRIKKKRRVKERFNKKEWE